MEDIRQLDRNIFLRQLLNPGRLLLTGALCAFWWATLRNSGTAAYLAIALTIGVGAVSAFFAAKRCRFMNSRFEMLWQSCQDRLERFHDAIATIRRHKIAQFEELPKTINAVHSNLYAALRRADVTYHEVTKSEGWLLLSGPPAPPPVSGDPQAQELYRLADKNVAEYRRHFSEVMAGVRRTEAQAAVFTTTLDTLRMKMLGYRLTGKRNEMDTQDFLVSITEAKMQLEAIDKALDELDLTAFPKTITVVPDPVQELRESSS